MDTGEDYLAPNQKKEWEAVQVRGDVQISGTALFPSAKDPNSDPEIPFLWKRMTRSK